jgi:hypothetical protein
MLYLNRRSAAGDVPAIPGRTSPRTAALVLLLAAATLWLVITAVQVG